MVKWVSSLSQKKYRDAESCFVAEGEKCARDMSKAFECKMMIAHKSWLVSHRSFISDDKIVVADSKQMQRISQFSTAADVICVYEKPQYVLDMAELSKSLNIVLDGIQDPGNLGTIIRLADWYGIHDILCNIGTVDVYNHKVIQATMGALSRVKVHYCDIVESLGDIDADARIYGTFLNGENIYNAKLENKGFVVLGNEGNGISKEVEKRVDKRLFIPSFPEGVETSESLNVGIAAAITISEIRRTCFIK